jgi:hypothetical protein
VPLRVDDNAGAGEQGGRAEGGKREYKFHTHQNWTGRIAREFLEAPAQLPRN